ncbi:MAG: DUF4956 domain-containing protein [Bacteroidetes bacterium GWE2_40_63]|nr:MAG: DUF4956 domain-containing protein [Bacteroidetes bacterium GWE2_40_63]OFY30255.1 MAG: DUF4956 domain-containing protein [Bacteroidetes bacterium GWF2_43_11]HCT86359.1 DUF4956 domain-containing protein [Candidatus Margulisiibacteriota bacterium]
MEELTNQLLGIFTNFNDLSGTFSMTDVIIALVLSYMLTSIVGYVYKITHKGTSYTQSYVHTLILMGMVVGVIMLIVGSNIARAFSLVGALSIIRFRNAVKETRDVGFIFFAMAIGMACGTRFYLLAIVSTLIISLLMLIMFKFDLYKKQLTGQMLTVRLVKDTNFEHLFDDIFLSMTSRADLVSIDDARSNDEVEVIYSIDLKRRISSQKFLESIRSIVGQKQRISLITGYNTTDL